MIVWAIKRNDGKYISSNYLIPVRNIMRCTVFLVNAKLFPRKKDCMQFIKCHLLNKLYNCRLIKVEIKEVEEV